MRARFSYGPDGARYRRVDSGTLAGGTTTTTTIGLVERRELPGNVIEWRRRIGSIAIVEYHQEYVVAGITQVGVAGGTRHQFNDRLGTPQVIASVGASGASVTVHERLDTAADGEWRSPDPPFGQAGGSQRTSRGFTGHEHLEGHGVIHMTWIAGAIPNDRRSARRARAMDGPSSGRLCWQSGGRMVQADPIVTEPLNPQSWNPYSYVLNNPLNLTDPSGYSFIGKLLNPFKHAIRSVMRGLGPEVSGALIGACAAVPGAWSIACAAGAGYDHARAFGATAGDARRSGVAAAFSATVTWGVKTYGGNLSMTSRVAIAASSGGVASVIQGGKFGHGFVSAGVTAQASPYVSNNMVIGSVTSAIIGGTVSEMTGGKFANGAMSGAFAYVVAKGVNRLSGFNGASGGSAGGAYDLTEGSYDVGGETFRYKLRGPDGYGGVIQSLLDQLAETDAGIRLLQELARSSGSVVITYSKGAIPVAHHKAFSSLTTITFDPDVGMPIQTNIGQIVERPYLVLGHELHHAWMNGLSCWLGCSRSLVPSGSVPRGLLGNPAEAHAVRYTNMIRSQAGVGYQRTHYDGVFIP